MSSKALVLLLVMFAALSVRAAQGEDASQLEAVIDTTKGAITIRFFPKEAPKHVAHFIETARKGGFTGTTFHRAIAYAIVQGGDPISKDPKKKALYGTGAQKLLPDEINPIKHNVGAVSAVAVPGPTGDPLPNSSGTQFFICDTPQPKLDGKYTVFGWVTDGMDVVRAISIMPASPDQKLVDRVEIKSVTVRPVTPTAAELAKLRAHIQTTAGEIVLEFLPTAPENARSFVRLARAGFYDGTTIYRAIPDMLIQGASPEGWPADSPNRKRSFSLWPLPDEFTTSVQMDRGIVGMAHGSDPNSATIHWFVLVGRAQHLDGKYTAFARVVSGIEVAEAISRQPAPGEKLTTPVTVTGIRIE